MHASRVVRPALVLAAVSVVWWIGVLLSDRYTNTVLNFWIVLGIQLVGLAIILRHSATFTRGYWRQVLNGMVAFAVLAVALSVVTWVGWEFIAPDYAERAVDMVRTARLARGVDPLEAEAGLDVIRAQYTPLRQAWFVIPGTLATGLAGSLLLAIPFRDRSSAH